MMMAMTAVMMGMTAVMMGMTAVMMAMTAVMMGMTAMMTAVVTTAVMASTMMTAVVTTAMMTAMAAMTAMTAMTGRCRQWKEQGSRYCTNKRKLSHPLFLHKTGITLQHIRTLASTNVGTGFTFPQDRTMNARCY
jgi:hypothetical protein